MTLAELKVLVNNLFTSNSNKEITAAKVRPVFSIMLEELYVPAGCIMIWPGPTSTIPNGWWLCSGEVFNIADYPVLYANLGGENSPYGVYLNEGTFLIPNFDFNQTVIQAGGTYFPHGSTGGQQSMQLGLEHMPAHSHQSPTTNGLPGGYETAVGTPTGGTGYDFGEQAAPTSSTGGLINGESKGFSLMQPYIAMNYIIKLT